MKLDALLSLLDEYDATWESLRQERLSTLSNKDVTTAKSNKSIRPLFLNIADISFKIIEGYQQQKGTHVIPVVDSIDNRLDTAKIRQQLAGELADA